LFIHQNFPGQFKHIIKVLAENPSHSVTGIGDAANRTGKPPLPPRVRLFSYNLQKGPGKDTHHYIRDYEAAIRRGQEVVRMALSLKKNGFVPDVVVGHTGWGEVLFMKEVFPEARHVSYFEYFYHFENGDVGFDPEFPASFDGRFRIRARNSVNLLSLNAADAGISPTRWQKSLYPEEYQKKIHVIHEGIDTSLVKPSEQVELNIDGCRLTKKDTVITYVARNLEPYRGFHIFMRTVPEILKRCPECHIMIVGGDGVSYGRKPPKGECYRDLYSREIDGNVDWSRIHFTGQILYNQYLKVLQLSSVHVYLTYPFVLSWSMLEAMAAGCRIVASATPPVEEVVKHRYNGLLVDFFNKSQLADTIDELISRPERFAHLGQHARATIEKQYDLHRVCLPQMLDFIQSPPA